MGTRSQVNPIPYLETVDTPTLSNAIEELNIRPRSEGFAPVDIRCLFPQFGGMCGYAVTAQVETVTRMSPTDKNIFCDLFEAVDASPKPAVVVMQEIGGAPEFAAHCGEVMATVFTRMGAIGVVSDCGVRDIPEVRAMGMHYFARGAVASHAYFHIVRVGVPVQIQGFVVKPGDILHGDENGLISVPECDWAALERAVDDVRDRERRLMDFVRSEACTIGALRKRFLE
ncbi:MAG: RraA family protein [Acidobacteria bacterium]|nr:RraA family protein [Acidobacteriota bacterium]